MNEAMHTPWTARSDGDDLWTVEDASGGVVFFGMDEDVAHIFAAAPEMLAALQGVVAALAGRVHSNPALKALADAEAAILAAEGPRS